MSVTSDEVANLRQVMDELHAAYEAERDGDFDGDHPFSPWRHGFGDGLAFSLMALDRPELIAALLASLLEEVVLLTEFRKSEEL